MLFSLLFPMQKAICLSVLSFVLEMAEWSYFPSSLPSWSTRIVFYFTKKGMCCGIGMCCVGALAARTVPALPDPEFRPHPEL